MTKARDTQYKKSAQRLGALMLTAALCFGTPGEAKAQCEAPGTTAATAATVVASQTAAITAMTTSLTTLYISTTTASSATMISLLEGMETIINNRMRRFWDDWEDALKSMTIQLTAATNDQSRQMASLFDSSNLTETARGFQTNEWRSHQNYAPTEAGCRFDTTSTYLATAGRTTTAVSNALSQELTAAGNNNAGTPAAQGQGAVNKARFEEYRTRFCDHLSNGGGTACGGTSASAPNAHIMPSVTLFSRETIDMTDKDTEIAVKELVYNITGYEVPDVIDPQVLESPQGKESRQNNRGYLAQMDAVNALVFSIVAERAPSQGESATASTDPTATRNTAEIQQIRQRMGISDASANASQREIRQSIMEQLWDPGYYVGLTDNATSVSQKEVFLQAYNLLLLYRMYEKAELISGAYAVETSNMLDKKAEPMRKGGQQYAPVRR